MKYSTPKQTTFTKILISKISKRGKLHAPTCIGTKSACAVLFCSLAWVSWLWGFGVMAACCDWGIEPLLVAEAGRVIPPRVTWDLGWSVAFWGECGLICCSLGGGGNCWPHGNIDIGSMPEGPARWGITRGLFWERIYNKITITS